MPVSINGSGTVTGLSAGSFQAAAGPVVGTQASASGTAVDVTGIPSWAQRVTVLLDGVSLSGTASILIQLGTSSGIETSSYAGSGRRSTSMTSSTAGFIVLTSAATQAPSGALVLYLMNASTNKWVANGNFAGSDSNNYDTAGVKSLAAALDRIRVTSSNGTDTFDAGTINIMWE